LIATGVRVQIVQAAGAEAKTVNFKEFCAMVDKVRSGAMPSTTGIPSLIKSAWCVRASGALGCSLACLWRALIA
jgi:hypothetical protein